MEGSPDARKARICCLDLDTFFVSVERLLDPLLEGRPVIVGGRDGRGVVTAASYEVRKFGVRSGMSMAEAVRLAPHAVTLPTRHGVYSPYAKQVRGILERYTPVVQTASIDEFFLDFHGCDDLYARPGDRSGDDTIARTVTHMRGTIRTETGLPASAGIATSRMMAKMASGLAKPAGTLLVPAGRERAVTGPLDIRKVPGIGPATEARLRQVGIDTVDDLLHLPPGPLRASFGGLAERLATTLDGTTAALGKDRPAFLEHDPAGSAVGSISNERTFYEAVGDHDTVHRQLRGLSERVCWRARRRQVRARTIGLKLRYSTFETLTRSVSVAPTCDEAAVLAHVLDLYRRARTRQGTIRLLGVSLSNFVGPDQQVPLPFAVTARPVVGKAIDAVRDRFGYDAIRLGAVQGSSWLA